MEGKAAPSYTQPRVGSGNAGGGAGRQQTTSLALRGPGQVLRNGHCGVQGADERSVQRASCFLLFTMKAKGNCAQRVTSDLMPKTEASSPESAHRPIRDSPDIRGLGLCDGPPAGPAKWRKIKPRNRC